MRPEATPGLCGKMSYVCRRFRIADLWWTAKSAAAPLDGAGRSLAIPRHEPVDTPHAANRSRDADEIHEKDQDSGNSKAHFSTSSLPTHSRPMRISEIHRFDTKVEVLKLHFSFANRSTLTRSASEEMPYGRR